MTYNTAGYKHRLSLVINTCAKGPHALDVRGSGKHASPHAWRSYVLQYWLLPTYMRWLEPRGQVGKIEPPTLHELIVVGEWEECAHTTYKYKYVPLPSRHFNCADALAQRQAGFEASTGDVVIFQHDDHLIERPHFTANRDYPVTSFGSWGVLVPTRWTRGRTLRGEMLNNGRRDGYISGHAAAYRREVLEACPWGQVPEVFTWDIEHTNMIRAAGFEIAWSDPWRVWDVEPMAEPWR